MSKSENNKPLKPTSHENFLNLRFPDGNVPIDFEHNNYTSINDPMGKNREGSGGERVMNNYVSKDTFEQFEKRIDDKLESLPDRMADKMDAKISGLEARQTKWFVGIAISTAIGGLSLIVGAIGLIINIFI